MRESGSMARPVYRGPLSNSSKHARTSAGASAVWPSESPFLARSGAQSRSPVLRGGVGVSLHREGRLLLTSLLLVGLLRFGTERFLYKFVCACGGKKRVCPRRGG